MRLAFGALFSAFLAAWGAEAAQPLTFLSQAARQQSVEFDVFLPLQNVDQLDELIHAQHTKGSPSYHQWLTPAEFRARFGPNPHAVERISARLRAAGLTVTVPRLGIPQNHPERRLHLVDGAAHMDAVRMPRRGTVTRGLQRGGRLRCPGT